MDFSYATLIEATGNICRFSDILTDNEYCVHRVSSNVMKCDEFTAYYELHAIMVFVHPTESTEICYEILPCIHVYYCVFCLGENISNPVKMHHFPQYE